MEPLRQEDPRKEGEVEPLRQEAQGTPSASEYPIRALVRGSYNGTADRRLAGTVSQWKRRDSGEYESPCSLNNCACDGQLTWFLQEDDLILDPTPQQIAEERAKAGLPAEAPADGTEAEPIRRLITLSQSILDDMGQAEWGSHEDGAAMYREFISTWHPRLKAALARAERSS